MSGEKDTTIKESQKEIQLPVSLRDYFAAKAMVAILTNIRALATPEGLNYASKSYEVADAMLAERSK